MAIKATLRQPASLATVTASPKTIEVQSHVVDEQSAEDLAAALASGDTTPGEVANGESNLPAVRQPSQVPAVRADNGIGTFSGGAMSGDFDENDLKFPTLKIVQGSGPLSRLFNGGTLVYGDEELLPPPDLKEPAKQTVLKFVPVHIQKQYRENLSEADAAENMARVVSSKEEVYALGGSTEWIADERPSWSPSARCLFLLQQPEGNQHPSFSIELDGKLYAPAVYYVTGGAYGPVVKGFYNTLKTSLLVPVTDAAGQQVRGTNGLVQKRGMLWKCLWSWQTFKVVAGKFTPFRPTTRPLFKEETGPEIRAYCETLLGSVADQAAE